VRHGPALSLFLARKMGRKKKKSWKVSVSFSCSKRSPEFTRALVHQLRGVISDITCSGVLRDTAD
jgi:hypothetical protein